ncbi:hypothetical protein SAMN05216360_101322 [Methylobacterium phyllostachyos]|uniref:DUF2946 domain-containing protein n=1 Tax=Methylobacterium phyllostachyos TaxID=582672 RepID=A0A1G9RNW2_9HYPH|nr:hypothetical protein [Methylobacterium phyllostachyos]SDM24831.1 hypothetical protein SAMN05216360_101322 [Methylobacterium phyllostachyos]
MACARLYGTWTGPGGRRPRLRPAGRRLLALLVLYALTLQSVLGGLAMAAAAGPEHVLCLAGGPIDRSAPDDPHHPAHAPMACCLACHVAAPTALPAPAPAEAVPALYPVALIRARPARTALPRAPPAAGSRARAPPPVV